MTAFADTHRGNRIELWDSNAERWCPSLLLLEDPRRCEEGCCNALAIRGVSGIPVRVHASGTAAVRLVPAPRAAGESSSPRADVVAPDSAGADPDPDAAYKAAQEDQINDDETGDQA